MALRLIYQMISILLGWIALHARCDTSKEIEILVLRDQLAVLRRRPSRPRLSRADPAAIAALSLWGSRTRPTPLTSPLRWLGMVAAVSLRLLCLIFQQVLGLVLLLGRTASAGAVTTMSPALRRRLRRRR